MRVIVAAALAGGMAAMAGGAPVAAEEADHPPVVLELFTSQGCSSCPPADALLARLAGRDDVLALSYHVDYWNYLGWRDTFSNPHATIRQKSYAKAMGQRMVYTPQLVVNGRAALVGSDVAAVEHAVAAAAEHAAPGGPRAHRAAEVGSAEDAASLNLTAEAGEALTTARLGGGASGVVVFVAYGAPSRVEVAHGENAGHALETTNPVLTWETLGRVGATETHWRTSIPDGAAGLAALMHGADGAIIASARVAAPGR